MKKLIIFGCGGKGQELFHMIHGTKMPGLSDYKVEAFCDNHYPAGAYLLEKKVIRPGQLSDYAGCDIVISSESILDDVMRQFRSMQASGDVYYYPIYSSKFKWSDDMPFLVKMDYQKPRLPYLEINIFSRCNLNCKGCSTAANIAKPNIVTIEELRDSFRLLNEKFSGIKFLKLFGGEPLLHPELGGGIVELSRQCWPDANIVVHSNGIAVPDMDEETLEVMNKYDIGFEFTLYPETGKKRRIIEQKIGKAGVEGRFRFPVYQFYKVINPKGDYDADEVYRYCGKCVNLRDGKLSCGMDTLIETLEDHYGVSICEDKYEHTIDLYKTELDGEGINRLLDSPFNLCRYCAFMMYDNLDVSQAYDWDPYSKGALEDWLIDEKDMR